MPIYEYECEQCSKRTELLQKVSDAPLAACPDCQGHVRKVVSPPGLHFKGSGWYVTDYAKKNGEQASKTDDKKPEKKETPPKAPSSPKPPSGSAD